MWTTRGWQARCSAALVCRTSLSDAGPRTSEQKSRRLATKLCLHTKITAEANSIHNNRITFTLQIPNEKFCKGISCSPKVAKFQQFLAGVHKRTHLQAILWGKLALAINTCRYDVENAKNYTVCVLTEPILLGWNPRMVGEVAAARPTSYRGPTSNFTRLLGQTMRKCRDLRSAWEAPWVHECWLRFPWFFCIRNLGDMVQTRMCN